MTASAGVRARLGLAVVCAGSLVGPFDTTVNTAFPVITEVFALAQRDIQWVVIAFVLAQSLLALVFGPLGDRFGHRRIFAIGLASSAIAHAAVALSPDFPTLIAARALQGMAVGITLSCAPALATLMFTPERKARVLAFYAATLSFGMAVAPWLGGLLLEAWGWPGVFWFRVPLALAALVCIGVVPSVPVVPRDPQARRVFPVIRLEPFRDWRFSGLQLASVAVNFGCFANLLVLPYVLTRDAGVSIVATGLMLSAYPSGSVLGSLVSARLADAVSPMRMMAAGLAIAAGGLMATALVLWLPPAPWRLVLGMLASGFGLGLFNVGYMDATTTMLPPGERGVAGSLVNVTRLVGVLCGAVGIGGLLQATGSAWLSFLVLATGLGIFTAVFAWFGCRQPTRTIRSANR